MSERTPYQAEQRRDLVVGLVLLVLGIVWTGIVLATIPPGNYGIGPRAFPLWLGVGLVALSAILAGGAWLRRNGDGEDPGDSGLAGMGWPVFRMVVLVCLILAAYGFLMQRAGFLLATALTIAFSLWVVLGERRPFLVGGMAIGMSVGVWLVFGQLLGAYLPRGTWLPF